MTLTQSQLQTFHAQGWLHLRGVLTPEQLAQVSEWTEQVSGWAYSGGPGLHHFEQTELGPALARSEDLVASHPGFGALLTTGTLPDWVSQLLGEPAVLYKEKINYKLPGGAGFAPHQDARAYRFVDHHISVMVPLDPATQASGCLHMAPGHSQGLLPADEKGCVREDIAQSLAWQPAEAAPGDVVLFDSYAPHYSGSNTTQRPRRVLYLTYNARSKGDFRDRYYADKRAEFHAKGERIGGERVRISVTGDFLGKPLSPPPLRELFARYQGPLAQALYDEAVTELQHGLQCAACARAEGASDALIAAALLHDVGHLVVGDLIPIEASLERDFHHEQVGARYLRNWFGPEICEPVRLHVAAKRYLVATEDYPLSPSSQRSLAVQGGPMSPSQAAAWIAQPGAEQAVQLRRWDDAGKTSGLPVGRFEDYTDLLSALAHQS